MISAKVKTCSKRPGFAEKTLDRLNLREENIWYDLRETNSEFRKKTYSWNVAKGWASFLSESCDHCMFMDDDLDFCDDFMNITETMSNTHPDAIVGLLPLFYNDKVLPKTDSPYWDAAIVPGACIIIPKKYLKDICDFMFSRCDEIEQDDLLIHLWCYYNHIQTITSIPSLIQHMGFQSICDPTKPVVRTQYFDRNPVANWNSKIVNSYRF